MCYTLTQSSSSFFLLKKYDNIAHGDKTFYVRQNDAFSIKIHISINYKKLQINEKLHQYSIFNVSKFKMKALQLSGPLQKNITVN